MCKLWWRSCCLQFSLLQTKGSCKFQSSTTFSLAIMNEYKVSVCSFNINGTKDKVLSLDEKLANHDVVLLQEHLLPSCSVNFLRRSSQHAVFTTNTRRTRGRPSGGLACIIKRYLPRYLSPSCYQSSEHYLAL